MTTEAEPTLAGEFPPATEEQWLALVDKVLKGAPLSRLRSTTPGGIVVEPLYTRDDAPAPDAAGVPGEAPFVRGSSPEAPAGGGWGIRALLSAPDPRDANRTALRELERGATELTVRFDAAFRAAVGPSDPDFADLAAVDGVLVTSTDDLAAVLDEVLVDVAPVHLEPGAQFSRAADLLLGVLDRRGVPASEVAGGIGADPLGHLATTGRLPQGLDGALGELGALAARLGGSHAGLRTVRVDTTPYVEAGASETLELATMLATGAAYLRTLAAAGLAADAACAQIEVTLSADADVFTTLAKLRAARRVWAAMTAGRSGLLHATTGSGKSGAKRLGSGTASFWCCRIF